MPRNLEGRAALPRRLDLVQQGRDPGSWPAQRDLHRVFETVAVPVRASAVGDSVVDEDHLRVQSRQLPHVCSTFPKAGCGSAGIANKTIEHLLCRSSQHTQRNLSVTGRQDLRGEVVINPGAEDDDGCPCGPQVLSERAEHGPLPKRPP